MTETQNECLDARDMAAQPGDKRMDPNYRVPLLTLSALLASVILVFFGSFAGIVDFWERSDTYAHGFFVLPISLYLIWRKRADLSANRIRMSPLALVFFLGALVLWLLARVANIQVVEQFAVISLLPVSVWLVLGTAYCRPIFFPLFFMFFGVPAGDFLIEPMMEFTADFTVAVIRLLGIPVFREGLFFSLPTGNWSVVEACSGIRYIIASLTLGSLYAYLTYNRPLKRGIFVLFSLLVPIIANGLRAVLIVLIGHFSSMKLATGVDHLIYGWLWFGIVIFIMFWVGSYFADVEDARTKKGAESTEQTGNDSAAGPGTPVIRTRNLVVVGVIAACSALGVRGWYQGVISAEADAGTAGVHLPESIGQWQYRQGTLSGWQPTYRNPTQLVDGIYFHDAREVGLFVAHYATQAQNAELINSENKIVDSHDAVWRRASASTVAWRESEQQFTIKESILKSHAQNLIVWKWNYIAGYPTNNDYVAKLLEIFGVLTGKGSAGSGVMVYVTFNGEPDHARQTLSDFLSNSLPLLQQESAYFSTVAPPAGSE